MIPTYSITLNIRQRKGEKKSRAICARFISLTDGIVTLERINGKDKEREIRISLQDLTDTAIEQVLTEQFKPSAKSERVACPADVLQRMKDAVSLGAGETLNSYRCAVKRTPLFQWSPEAYGYRYRVAA